MNDKLAPRARLIPGMVVNHRKIIGPEDQVLNVIRNAQRAGRLASRPTGRRLPGGQLYVNLMLLEPAPSRTTRRRIRWGMAAAVLTTAGICVTVAVLIVMWIAAHLALILAILTGLILTMAVLMRRGMCPGIHCPGCGHR